MDVNDNGSEKKTHIDANCDALTTCVILNVGKMNSHQKRIIHSVNFCFGCCYELRKRPRFPQYTIHIHKILFVSWPLFRITWTDSPQRRLAFQKIEFCILYATIRYERYYIAKCTQLQLKLHRPKCPEPPLGLPSCEQSIFHICFTILRLSLGITLEDIVTKNRLQLCKSLLYACHNFEQQEFPTHPNHMNW